MTIKEITISGFKSFARPTSFRLESGVTAVVGPNGSGKSNLADALRWVLGEQSVKTLRVKKTDDLIFAGTGAKARGSVAEVRVRFDNSDDLVLPEFSEVELSRKLYGSGESDYRLNGRKVRLADIQELLAKARIGAGTYAIIGQGMIDSLILATPAERKLLFEEASGIKEFELQRAAAMKRLRATEENMQRARDILAELAPRLATLERSRQSAAKRAALEAELITLREQQQIAEQLELQTQIEEGNAKIERLQDELNKHVEQIKRLTTEQKVVQTAQKQAEVAGKQAMAQLNRLEASREQLLNDASVQQAELQHLRERLGELDALATTQKSLEGEARALAAKLTGAEQKLAAAQKEQSAAIAERDGGGSVVRRLQQQLVKQRKLLQDDNQTEYVVHAQTIVSDLHRALEHEEIDKPHLQALAQRVRRLLRLATERNQEEALGQLRVLQTKLGDAIRDREVIDARYTRATLHLRSCELDVAAVKRESEELTGRAQQLKRELLQGERSRQHVMKREHAIAELQERLQANQAEIEQRRQQLSQGAEPSITVAVEVARELERQMAARDGLSGELKNLQAEHRQLTARAKPKLQIGHTKPAESAAVLGQRVVELAARLATLRELGHDVELEHAEVKERHDFLISQLEDLEQARSNVLEVTEQLSGAMQAQFASAFAEISERFSALFQELFGGGAARLALDESSEGEMGIEIEVVPPGKRTRHLTALSGGERSLAALALLAAIVQVNPSPILVLDEVDAALDEANAARFSQLLNGLAENSQVLVITHNRQTMMAASALFGITMDHQHVSQTVSVQLDEAAALIKT